MKNFLLAIFSLFMIAILSSCGQQLTPFSQRMVDEHNWSESDLQKVQFYLSENIVLRRDIGGEDSRIKDGKIKVVDGRKVEEVRFEKGTPGVMIFTPKSKLYAISFDSSDDKYLMFGPSKKQRGKYVLKAKDWNKNYGKVSYNGKIYTTPASSAFSSLLVDIKKAKKVSYKSQTAKGRKI